VTAIEELATALASALRARLPHTDIPGLLTSALRTSSPGELGRERAMRRVPPPAPVFADGTNAVGENYGIATTELIQTGHGNPNDTRVATIALGFQELEIGDGLRQFSGLGELVFGVGGTKHTVQVDWRTGTQLSFPCSFAELTGSYAEVNGPGEVEPGEYERVKVRGTIAWGHRGARAYPTRTFARYVVPPAAGVALGPTLPVPPFAFAFQLGATAYPVTLFVDFLSGPVGPVVQSVGAAVLLVALTTEGVKFPGHARFWRLRDDEGNASVTHPFFALAL